MGTILLTQDTTFIIGPVASLLGWIMNGIYSFLSIFGVTNIALCIILFTLIVYLLMTPLTIRQQRFSKLSAKMNPEIQAINKKYKGKTDQASVMKMQAETKAVYDKYGASATGSCLQLAIQLPIIYALWRVINNIPAYVQGLRDVFMPLINSVMDVADYQSRMESFVQTVGLQMVKLNFSNSQTAQNSLVDTFYKLSPEQWDTLAESFPSLSDQIQSLGQNMSGMNNFLGINIADSPSGILMSAFSGGNYLLVCMALAIPILSVVTQIINIRLMPQPTTGNDNNSLNASMKTMNVVMPFISGFFCLTWPTGMSVYWISGSVIRSIQQVVINKHLDKLDIEDIIKKNREKAEKRREKKGLPPNSVAANAKISAKNIEGHKTGADESKKSTDYYNRNPKPGSLAAKANMVKYYNEKNNKQGEKS